ncbi:MAG: hypothetical protein K0Q95_1335 [Bacteroidota bacterium]|jgi:hypothetical protein|nr:hypothetical protein [Bacteroidota bacterium]
MAKTVKKIPFDFVIENLHRLEPVVKPMFGAHAVYAGNKIVLILRDKDDQDSGVWIATTVEHHESLNKEFPNMHSISVFGPGVSSWQVLSKEDMDFEEKVNLLCDLILKGDPRIGKIPKPKKKKKI